MWISHNEWRRITVSIGDEEHTNAGSAGERHVP